MKYQLQAPSLSLTPNPIVPFTVQDAVLDRAEADIKEKAALAEPVGSSLMGMPNDISLRRLSDCVLPLHRVLSLTGEMWTVRGRQRWPSTCVGGIVNVGKMGGRCAYVMQGRSQSPFLCCRTGCWPGQRRCGQSEEGSAG